MFHCSYCMGKGHFTTSCLKRLTKNCDASICRDFNRFKTSKCTFNGSCVYGRQHICMFCEDQSCKAYFHVHGHTFQSPNLPKKNADILVKLSQALKTCLETINDLKSQLRHAPNERNESCTSEAKTLTEELLQAKHDGILALPVMCLDKQVTMPVSTGFPVSSVSIDFAKKILNASGNQTQLTSLHALTSNIVQADGSRLLSRNKAIVPLTFANNKTFQFEMLVIPELKEDIIFGNNHLRKTDAAINFQGLTISFKDPSMNFELSCIRREQNNNMLQAFTSVVDNT